MNAVTRAAAILEAESKRVLTYLDLVAATVLAYDYLLNIGDEAKYIWFSPLSLGKALYFLTRYSVIADMTLVLYQQFAVLDRGQCVVIFKTICYLFGIGTILTESVLILRTWVLWDRNKYIGATLVVGIVFCGAPSLYFLVQWVDSLVFANPLPHQPGCIMNLQKTDLFAAFIIFTGFESVILALTLMKYTRSWRRKKTTIIRTIFRDGITNYVYICILAICNVVVLLRAPHGYATVLLTSFQRVMHSILSSRVLLNLRQAAATSRLLGSTESEMHSAVLFKPWSATVSSPRQPEVAGVALRDVVRLDPVRRSLRLFDDSIDSVDDDGGSRQRNHLTVSNERTAV